MRSAKRTNNLPLDSDLLDVTYEAEHMAIVSQLDTDLLLLLRQHISNFLKTTAQKLEGRSGRLLEIGPQDRSEVRELFGNFTVDSFDIAPTFRPTHVGDITKHNASIADDSYDGIVCMEVIEHTLNPFGAIAEMHRILKHDGFLLISAPLNFRIHGPLPDCWRFTEHGFKVLLRDFEIQELDILESPGRDLFPVHYNAFARNDKFRQTQDAELRFRFIE